MSTLPCVDRSRRGNDYRQRIDGAVRLAFLKGTLNLRHLIRGMCETKDGLAACCSKGIEGGGLHLDCE